MPVLEPQSGSGQIEPGPPVPPSPPGEGWVPLDGSWTWETTETGTIAIITDFAFPSANQVTGQFGNTVIRDGLVEGATTRADPASLFTLLEVTEAQILDGEHAIEVWILPSGSQGPDGGIFGVGITNTNAKASMDGGYVGFRAGATPGQWRAVAGNAGADTPAVGTADSGAIFGTLAFAGVHPQLTASGNDVSNAAQNSAVLAGTDLAASTTLRLVLFGGCAFAGGGNSDLDAQVWFRRGGRGDPPA